MSKTKQKKVNPYAKQPEKKTNWPLIIVAVVLVAALIVALNVVLIVLTMLGKA